MEYKYQCVKCGHQCNEATLRCPQCRAKRSFKMRTEYINKSIEEVKEEPKYTPHLFMNINLDELIDKHTIDGALLKNGCATELVELTGINIEDAKNIINNTVEQVSENEELKSSIAATHTNSPVACCPKCGSTSITTTNEKLSVKRAVVGTLMLNPLAGAVGAFTSKKIYCICMNCGHRWKP